MASNILKRSNHKQRRHPNIAMAGDIHVEPDGVFQKLSRNLDNLSVKVPLTFSIVYTALYANLFEF